MAGGKMIRVTGRRSRRKSKLVTKKQVQRMIVRAGEQKRFDIAIDQTSSTAGEVVALSDVIQSLTQIGRAGLKIHPVSFEMRYDVLIGDTTNLVRVIVLQWKMDTADTGPPTISNILQDVDPFDALNSAYQFSERKKFKILYDRRHKLSSTGEQQALGFVRIKAKDLLQEINYNTGSGVQDAFNSLFFFTVSDSGAITHPIVHGFSRLLYTDV